MYTWRRNLLLSHVQQTGNWSRSSANQGVCCRWFGRSDVARSKCLLETISARWSALTATRMTFSNIFHVDCWLFCKNKQERRFRLAVTTFPVFVKRSLWISYKPPEYIRCNLCTFSTKFPRYRNEMHVAHSLPWCYLFFTLWWNQLSFSKTDGPALRTVGYEVS